MAKIAISDLRPAGSDLFIDSESYLLNLDDAELDSLKGGATPVVIAFTLGFIAGYYLH